MGTIKLFNTTFNITDTELELGRYRYLESVSVFGIFVGIFFMSVRYSVSVFLKYWLKIANFWYPTSNLAPMLKVTSSEFHSRVPIWKTRMMGPPNVDVECSRRMQKCL